MAQSVSLCAEYMILYIFIHSQQDQEASKTDVTPAIF